MAELVYSSSGGRQDNDKSKFSVEAASIYLGNLKEFTRDDGEVVFQGNIPLDMFDNIPDKFKSKSKKTGRDVVNIIINRNPKGKDMYGFTHVIRVNPYIRSVDHFAKLEDEELKRDDSIKNIRTGISENDIRNENDYATLLLWKNEIDKDLAKLNTTLLEAKLDKNKGVYADSKWYAKLWGARKKQGFLSQLIQSRLSETKRLRDKNEKDNSQSFFNSGLIDAMKKALPPDLCRKIIEEAQEFRNRKLSEYAGR